MVGCGSKDRHQKDMCCKEIGLHAHNLLTFCKWVLDVTVDGTEGDFVSYMTRLCSYEEIVDREFVVH